MLGIGFGWGELCWAVRFFVGYIGHWVSLFVCWGNYVGHCICLFLFVGYVLH